MRLWAWEHAGAGEYYAPLPYVKTGSKFDLTKFNPVYFTRLRQRVEAAQQKDITVAVMLFQEFSAGYLGPWANPWPSHPFHVNNNVNGINGDPNNDGSGFEIHTLAVPAITAFQKAYVARVVQTLSGLDVWYEICNECKIESKTWQYQMINYLHTLTDAPIGMTAYFGTNIPFWDDAMASNADWVSPRQGDRGQDWILNPPLEDRKIVIVDSDHIWGIGGSADWVWRNITRGHGVIFMDVMYSSSTLADTSPRVAMGQAVEMTKGMEARPSSCSTSFCMAGDGYLAYLPNGGGVTFYSITGQPEAFSPEWLDTTTGERRTWAAMGMTTQVSLASPFGSHAAAVRLVPYNGLGMGIGACHWIPASGMPDNVGWGYETTTPLHVRTLWPELGRFDWKPLDDYVGARSGVKLWLAFQTAGMDVYGNPKIPQWWIDEGIIWHTGTCGNGNGMVAPWDELYQQRLATFLLAAGQHIREQSYFDRIGGVTISSGGMYGEYQLWSCGMYDTLKASGMTDTVYLNSVKEVVLSYNRAFPDLPLMLKVGTPPDDRPIAEWFVRAYNDRAFVLWCGLDPDNIGDGLDSIRRSANWRYLDTYEELSRNSNAHFGFELGHPPYAGIAQYDNVLWWARQSSAASFMCVQGGAVMNAASKSAYWALTDRQLED